MTNTDNKKGGGEMEKFDIYKDIAERTNGDIYIGVVGPVRTGKSTFIKKFMEHNVLPIIEDKFIKERANDELPQSSSGRMIMTTEPKFVPEEAIEIKLEDNLSFRVRLIDCVGYTVPGAVGYEDEEGPRMVSTPWYDHDIPFQEAAEVGTQKVINEHSTIGLVITTDGSFTEIPRHNFVMAEERVVNELKGIGKPFIILLNSSHPGSEETVDLAQKLTEKYDVPVVPVDCINLSKNDIDNILKKVLYEFPVKEFYINLPSWLNKLPDDHWLKQSYDETIRASVANVEKIRDIDEVVDLLADNENTQEVFLENINLGEGLATISVGLLDNLFYEIIKEFSGFEVSNDEDLLSLIQDLSHAKKQYDKVAQAMIDVQEKGYGIVTPDLTDMSFDEPELIKRGNQFGVKLKASAPSIHMIRADIQAEVSPVVGTEKQSEELIKFLQADFDENPNAIWNTEFLGRSLHDLVQEGISNKLYRMPENVQRKLRDTIEKIVNEGSGGLLCIIL
ncbi:Sporulation stage IV protein A [Halothermothrix orenii H 168]|uniref:Sporulation stage IV protein A n=2 Tax=Halothermothrix orenii TaxID=31909 RepID=B8CWZ2_HALOH|nr:Sporulation stage IV protein A [Halothermothrix orenii H 168]